MAVKNLFLFVVTVFAIRGLMVAIQGFYYPSAGELDSLNHKIASLLSQVQHLRNGTGASSISMGGDMITHQPPAALSPQLTSSQQPPSDIAYIATSTSSAMSSIRALSSETAKTISQLDVIVKSKAEMKYAYVSMITKCSKDLKFRVKDRERESVFVCVLFFFFFFFCLIIFFFSRDISLILQQSHFFFKNTNTTYNVSMCIYI
jgi:hypothetical protein